ncbi:MAG: LCP family protein [Microbacteriaceae bacterium]|nr:LCP family protein [Microbacteriaceae bacterium]
MSNPKMHSTVARHGQLSKGSVWKKILSIIGASVAVVLVSGIALGGYVATKFFSALADNTVILDPEVVDIAAPDISSIKGGINILIIGVDNDANQGGAWGNRGSAVLNDVNILVHIGEDHSYATVVSFPRDLVIPIPKCGNYSAMSAQPLNSAYYYGGLSCVHKTITTLTGLDIPYAAEVSFRGVIGLSNAVGGTEVCLTKAVGNVQYAGYKWDAGRHTLMGGEALAFLRTRHGIGDGSDLSRINLQQTFMSSLLRTVTADDTLTNPVKLYNLAQVATTNMTLSSSMANLDTIVGLAQALKDLDLDKVSFVTYPGKTNSVKYPGKVEPIPSLAKQLFQYIQSDTPVIPNDPARINTKTDQETEVVNNGQGAGKDAVKLPAGIEGVVAGSPVCVG